MNDTAPRLKSARDGLLGAGPETLQLNLANACNLDCVFCWNHSPRVAPRPAEWHGQRLSDAHLDGVLADLERLRPARLLLSGRGEPLLHPRVEELLLQAQELAIPVTVQTNGSCGPEPQRLAELGVDRLLVNLSAATAEGYARVHPGSARWYATTLGRLRRIAALARPRITLTAVVCRENIDQIVPLAELSEQLSAPLFLKGMEWSAELEALTLEKAEALRVQQLLEALASRPRRSPIDSAHLRAVASAAGRGSKRFSAPGERLRCLMGWFYLRVTCEGEVMFCCKDKPRGHLDQRSLYDIWRSPRYHLWRLAGRDGDMQAGLFDEKCQRCSNVARNSELLRRYDAGG